MEVEYSLTEVYVIEFSSTKNHSLQIVIARQSPGSGSQRSMELSSRKWSRDNGRTYLTGQGAC